jgi:uracil DNA glycosylase
MSLDIQVNNIVKKLKQKYENSSWQDIMNEVLEYKYFRSALTTLMKNHQNGIKFQPDFNSIFQPFDTTDFKFVKVVIVYPHALAKVPEYENKNGVLLLRSPITVSPGIKNAEIWDDYIKQLIDQISYRTVKTIFVFVGEETEKYKGVVRNGQYKMFVPMKPDFNIDKIQTNINNLLESIGKNPIVW